MQSNTKYTFGYFYPTSPNAQASGLSKGGYSVSKIGKNGFEMKPVAFFKTEEEAKAKCNQLMNQEVA